METTEFRSLKISLASPEQIRSWSYGEVTKPETINYRRLRPEKDGLFCEAIFGPTRDWQCYCGKYKNIRYKGIVCDKCGVEITRSSVRRERLGHIELAAPVAHVWYTRRVPSYMGLLLNVSRRNLDRVLYFAQYVITSVDDDARERALKRLDEELAEAELRLEQEMQGELADATSDASVQLQELENKLAELNASFDDRLAEITDEVVRDAKTTEQRLENLLDAKASEDIVLGDEVIAKEGELIGREHIVLVQEVTTERLTKVQQEYEEEHQALVADSQKEISELRLEADAVGQEQRDLVGAKMARLRQQYQTNRELLESLSVMQFLNETEYRELKSKFGNVFKADMGAEALHDILRKMDLDQLSKDLWREVRTTRSKQAAKRATRRLQVVEALRQSGNRPEWMIMTVLPVIPPDLRPMVQLDGGRFATSDLNDLYRRVINRNNRLKRLLELGAPDVIVRNEKRMLQESVDSLIDNSQRGKALSRRGRRELKSLSDMLKGKKGRFRRNLLGKRVDYSGRSVIVVGPKLKLGQCGLPKVMALELFRPFVISKLVQYGYASNVKGAKRFIERQQPEVWQVLEEVIVGRPIMLNRAPTLHRLGIQAFMPSLVEGKAIKLHPLVCAAFNADFDGDQMAVHVPLSDKAVAEAKELMMATRNLLKPANGEPIVGPSKDMVLGVYYLTLMQSGRRGEGRVFGTPEEVETAYELGLVDIHAKIKLDVETYFKENHARYADGKPRRRLIETSPGRVLFNMALPPEYQFVNRVLDKGSINTLINRVYRIVGDEATIKMVDAIKDIGFKYATISGTTIAVADLTVPDERQDILDGARQKVDEIDRQYRRGLLTEDEQYQRTVEQWNEAKDQVEKAVRTAMDPGSPIAIMALSGAGKGGFGPITQLAGMRGLMADPSGRIIVVPIQSNFRMGLNTLEYFISTHGSRKGLADTALRTADAGYLTRRLVDIAQDIIIIDDDCGTRKGIYVRRIDNFGKQTLGERLYGRVAAESITDPETGEILIHEGEMYTDEIAKAVDETGVDEVYVYSAMTCELRRGACKKCYGLDLARGKLVETGTAVGIVAAQSIGEPGTQLTLRTFHTGGTASAGGDITQGLPRVEELFEARQRPKGEAVMTEIGGIAEIRIVDGVRHVFITESKLVDDVYEIPEGWDVKVGDEDEVETGGLLAENEDEVLPARHGGRVSRQENTLTITWESRDERDYDIPAGMRLLISDGQKVQAGDQLTEGSKNPHRILEVLGRDAVTQYLLREMQKVYRPQGQNIHDKHFEVIIRKMLSKVMLTASGDTDMLPGELVEFAEFQAANEEIIEEGGIPAQAEPVLLGITKASLNTDSFLSASSFQHTIKVLAGAAIGGREDKLHGLKENVIIGKLIPAGTGFHLHQQQAQAELEAAQQQEGPEVDAGIDLSKTLIGDDTDEEVLAAMMAAAAAEAAQAKRLSETFPESVPESELEVDGD
ncbi:MAG: DNA-directed RNA polymerase subunit beta' [Chloroflexi bacterium]|nr:MAG: DNA-directed RNA polymerase subunit beta' [Chloroflexota bacterium]PIE80997.1 MAG: DNA-directed RNA polymerase subunit beta' [Chloroflexota bacterium]